MPSPARRLLRSTRSHSAALAVALAGCALATAAAAPEAPGAALPVREIAPVANIEDRVLADVPRREVRRVGSAAELVDVLRSEFRGRVVVPRDVSWDLTGQREIPLRSGVELIGERGALGSRPMLETRDMSAKHSLFEITGNDVRVEGLHLRGPKPGRDHKQRDPYVNGISIVQDAERELGRRVLIADNEFDRWTGGAVSAIGSHGSVLLENWDPSWKHLEPRDAALVRVERNYMHHNAMDGGGYGVVVGGGAYVTVIGNVFDYNRHAVAASGKAYSGYVARFNYVLQGGYMQHANNAPDFHNQHFDVHGTADDGYGGYAGEYFEIAHNTIRGEQGYYAGLKSRPAFMLRGRPAQGAHFNYNVAVHDDLDEAVSLKHKGDTGWGEDHDKFNFHARGNRFDTDHSKELASGDFDGDGRTDVFVANGTAWFFSRAGIRPWELLHISNKRTGDLGFADIDNDRITDVLWRDGAGRVHYLSGGRSAPRSLTSSPVPMKDLRFGDFDGDGLSDIFYTRGGRWRVWYGATRAWTRVQSSAAGISELLFGEFDGVRGTDVARSSGSAWWYSSGARSRWTRLNGRHTKSFDRAIAADVDGNGRTDIVYHHGYDWRYSRDGRSAPRTLIDGSIWRPAPALKQLVAGAFDGGADRLVGFSGDRLAIWHGPGSGAKFVTRSAQNMR